MATFCSDLANLLITDRESVYATALGVYVGNLRTQLARAFLGSPLEWLVFIDSDMRFPPDTAARLRSHHQPIVGCNCKQRTQNLPTARTNGQWVTSQGKSGLEEVDTVGFGVTLVHRDVFENIGSEFDMPWDASSGKAVGEDTAFCQKARKAGFPILIDHDLSQSIKHTGSVELGW